MRRRQLYLSPFAPFYFLIIAPCYVLFLILVVYSVCMKSTYLQFVGLSFSAYFS